jgi:wobble nucleotide-excising tRNase
MIPFDANEIETVAKLMEQYGLDEYASERFSLKKSRHKMKLIAVDEAQAALAKHLAPPLDPEPWNAVGQETADEWAARRSAG